MASQKFTLKQTAKEVQNILDKVPELEKSIEDFGFTEVEVADDIEFKYHSGPEVSNPNKVPTTTLMTPDRTNFVCNSGYISLNGYHKIESYIQVNESYYQIAFYDSEKQFISEISQIGENSLKLRDIDLTLEKYNKAAYVVFCYWFRESFAESDRWVKMYRMDKQSIATDIEQTIAEFNTKIEAITKSAIDDKNILIFGDSITDSCAFTINESNQTTSYKFNNNSQWPSLLNNAYKPKEIRNYAKSQGRFMDWEADDERKKVSYQIELAFNDLTNPGGAFNQSDFIPDVVVFALGTNDGSGSSSDTYENVIAKNFDDLTYTGTFGEAVRKALGTIRKKWPQVLMIVLLPIARMSSDIANHHNRELLTKLAHYEGCIVLDGFECGITRENNIASAAGETLKDGLHPNKAGSELMARQIYKCIESNYLDLSIFN